MIPELNRLFEEITGEKVQEITEFPSSGSNRKYFRLKSWHFTRIGVWGASPEENRAFVYLSAHLRKQGLPVPEVYEHTDDYMYYVQEDLGDTLLFDALEGGRKSGEFSRQECLFLQQTIRLLPVLQFKGAENLDFSRCYPRPEFDRRSVFWDLNYFKYCFLKATGIEFSEDKLEDDFDKLADTLLEEPFHTFMYRDFQARNVMLKEGTPFFIDFQGGRKGPLYYDVASFLWQAKANYPEKLRAALLDDYLEALQAFMPVDPEAFKKRLRYFVLFRSLQVLGAYGFRGYFEKKRHFLESVPFAISNLRNLLEEGFPEYPYLDKTLRDLCDRDENVGKREERGLTVQVYSFSYRKGIPEDFSGNGGGFVFDCRAIHNPGKYEAYKCLTGLDEPVIRFLEEDGEVLRFMESVYALVDASVERYRQRGFTSLMVCFGCTGGQHRSVYCAQHLAEYVYRKWGVNVHLLHREREIERQFKVLL
ncbi:phosphotransferase [Odoribacter laneus]|uniref:RapZ C-terminal domain-containing protein n=1 Tax=Odoribacter laneus TaxID=626933 RepID=UPI0039961F3F